MATSNSSTNSFNSPKVTYTAGFCIETEAGPETRRLKSGLSHAAAISFAEDAADVADAEGIKVLYISAYRD